MSDSPPLPDEIDHRIPRPANILYLVSDDRGICKIGVTRLPARRLSTLRSHYPYPLRLLGLWEFPRVTSAQLEEQRLLEAIRSAGAGLNGEWFLAFSDNALAFVKGSLSIEPRSLEKRDFAR